MFYHYFEAEKVFISLREMYISSYSCIDSPEYSTCKLQGIHVHLLHIILALNVYIAICVEQMAFHFILFKFQIKSLSGLKVVNYCVIC